MVTGQTAILLKVLKELMETPEKVLAVQEEEVAATVMAMATKSLRLQAEEEALEVC
jgi:ABC-type arginine transport system ATPase subunit